MKEISIIAGFKILENAKKAAQELREMGCSTVQLNGVSNYPGEGVEKITNPIQGKISSLGSMTLDADFPSGRDASVMAAVDPSASGMADRGAEFNMPGNMLTVLVDDAVSSNAEKIIQKYGGMF
ncbi:hypothetical protein [Brevibacillus daliensis]|uniref:hypothetical protein n=1 Tax=Brevibacillus daliensis TaxID=2892995 RepID=UPI001E61A20A|nr:hypothetical protein [Brevibacillus daliensis]